MNSYYHRHKDLNKYLGLTGSGGSSSSSASNSSPFGSDYRNGFRSSYLSPPHHHHGNSSSRSCANHFLSSAAAVVLPSRFRRHSVDHTALGGGSGGGARSMPSSAFSRGLTNVSSEFTSRSSSSAATKPLLPFRFTSPMASAPRYRESGSGSSFHPDISEIQPYLFLCAAFPVTSRSVRDLRITCIINITSEIGRQEFPGVDYIHLQANDHPEERIDGYFGYCADKIRYHKQSGGRTLVHCVAGRSRSVSIILAYLMKYESMRLADAYNHVKCRRPIIHPNLGFWKQLVQYESSLFGFNSVKMVKHARFGLIPDVYEKQYSDLVW